MTQVFLSLGSNHNCEQHLRQALLQLSQHFGKLSYSSVYRSPPINGAGNDYCNMAINFDSKKPVSELISICKTIETSLGRKRQANGDTLTAIISIDIDVLLVGDNIGHFTSTDNKVVLLPHSDIERYSHVLVPLTELAPHYIHPHLKISFQQLLNNKKFSSLKKCEFALNH